MKNSFLTLITMTCIMSSVQLNAQTFEGKITMKMEALNLTPEMESMRSMLESNVTTYTRRKKSRTETSNPMTGKMFVITDMDKNEVVMCMDMMGQKTAIMSTVDEYSQSQSTAELDKMEFIPTKETKMILGHLCTKTIARVKEGEDEIDMEYWCANDIQNANAQLSELPGMPLEYSINAMQLTMHFIATEITKENVPKSMFEIPADYTRKSAEEFKQQYQGGTKK